MSGAVLYLCLHLSSPSVSASTYLYLSTSVSPNIYSYLLQPKMKPQLFSPEFLAKKWNTGPLSNPAPPHPVFAITWVSLF